MRAPLADALVRALVNVKGRLLEVLPRLSALGLFVGPGAVAAWAVAGLAQAALRAADPDRAAIRWGLWRNLLAGGIRRSPAGVLAGALGAVTSALAALLALDAVGTPASTRQPAQRLPRGGLRSRVTGRTYFNAGEISGPLRRIRGLRIAVVPTEPGDT